MHNLKELKIEVTQKCPLNCLHCSSESNKAKDVELSFKEVSKVVQEAKEMGVKKIAISGGEPLLYDYLIDVIKECNRHYISTIIYTTGIKTIKLEIPSDKYIKDVKRTGINKIIFSIHGSVPETHDKITRISGSFEKTINSVKRFIRNGINCEFHFVPLKLNFKELARIYILAKKLHIERISVLRFVPQGRGELIKDLFSLSCEEHKLLRKMILELRSKNKVQIRVGSPYNILLLEKDVHCEAAKTRMIIVPNGNAYPCDAFKRYEYKNDCHRNIKENTLDHIWRKSEYLVAVRNYLETDIFYLCKICEDLNMCKCGCLAQKVLKNGNFKKDKDPNCLRDCI